MTEEGAFLPLDKVKALTFAARNPRVVFNPWNPRRGGVRLRGRAWIPGRVELALAGRASLEIGAGSVVCRDIPGHTIAAGSPATVIRERC